MNEKIYSVTTYINIPTLRKQKDKERGKVSARGANNTMA
jgi:hypothetical protein